jgi:predicted transcriptional regulator
MMAKMTKAFKRRDKLVIMAEITEISKNGALKTQIMYRANLSFAQLNDYLRVLMETSLLEKTSSNGKEVYRSTSKGREFLEKHTQVINLLRRDSTSRINVRMPPEILFG